MEIIPAIDLRDGRCVRLYQGDFEQETVFSQDPAQVARRWHELGAPRIHVVDLDGAKTGRLVNSPAIRAILEAVPVPIELGGGIRTLETIEETLEWGVERVVLGTAAVKDPTLVRQACDRFPGAIVVGVDARAGEVAIRGWLEQTGAEVDGFVRRFSELGVPRFIFTDIQRDATKTGPNLAALRELLSVTDSAIIASGGVGTLEDVRLLSELGVEGVIIGMALYTGAIDLAEALDVAAEKEAQ